MTRDDAVARPVRVDTRFDLASITKLFASTLALQAVADGSLALDEPLLRWFPEWTGTDHASITLRMLLAHDSGMNSGADYRLLLAFDVERFAIERDLVDVPGSKVIYSDLGFIALGALIARVRGASLASVFGRAMGGPTVGYHVPFVRRPDVPATEQDDWRGRVQGRVHDEKAFLMGGVAGHAGLFGAASDVARLTEAYLGPLCGRANSSLPLELVREAVREQAFDPTLRRGLGWALKTNDANSCGRLFARETFGHTGFVGTCVWADPTRDVQGVLLTNTVYFGRCDTRDLRASFYEALIEDIEA
ncbi:MAG: beta-lactamase family protein [Candidatus Eremiobacteraeota bacterium]|nr:beta-lactamase family protein [Candidatus Eremiobacteraeota bacterium]